MVGRQPPIAFPLRPFGAPPPSYAGLSGKRFTMTRVHAPITAGRTGYFLVVETQKGSGMRYSDSTLGRLLKPISRRWFDALVDRHAGNAYDKSFGRWDHLVALVYAQLGGITSLRALEAAWNANAPRHYPLWGGALARSTLADANAPRPLAL